MTKPTRPPRNRAMAFFARHGPLLAIMLLAALVRLDGIAFGLPSLNDPDEPLFMLLAFGMLERGSLDPQWFGHPGTITLYSLALVMLGVAGAGLGSGRFADLDAFAQAVYLDPGLVILPSRMFIAANGVACVWLTYLIAHHLWGRRAGLLAAGFLAINAVHVGWSQVIRTDVQASVFMLLGTLAALAMLRGGSVRSHVAAGACAALACATKWPAAIILLSPLAVALYRQRTDAGGWREVLVLLAAAGVTLLVVSPFLLPSYQLVLANLAGEARANHPGSTGGNVIENLGWYLAGPLAQSLGWAGLALALAGIIAAGRSRAYLLAVVPAFAAFVVVIAAQSLVWERWIVPLLPFVLLGLGRAVDLLADRAAAGSPRRGAVVSLALALLLSIPMLSALQARTAERDHDTRQMASTWLLGHVPPGSTVVVENAAFDLLRTPWTLKFPLGTAGCVDARAMLGGKISATTVEDQRGAGPIVDLGNVPAALMDSCRADFYVLANVRRYQAERENFPEQYRRYAEIMRAGHIVAEIKPAAGEAGGPTMVIVARSSSDARPVSANARLKP